MDDLEPDLAADDGDADLLNLKQVARILDVHYMTAYRYVRHGRLAAERVGGMWMVRRDDLDSFRDEPTSAGDIDWAARLAEHLGSGDDVVAWAVVRDAANAGRTFEELHLDVVTGALARLAAAEDPATVVEHRIALATASRLVGRLGGLVTHRGRKLGTVVLAAPTGEHHGLGLAVLANLIRQAGFRVLELGTDAPAADICAALDRVEDPVALGLGVTTVDVLEEAAGVVAAVADAHPDVPVLLGGQAVRNPEVAELVGAQAWATSELLVDALRDLAAERTAERRRTTRRRRDRARKTAPQTELA